MTRPRTMVMSILLAAAAAVGGCASSQEDDADPRTDQADARVRAKWGKGIDELPARKLDVISPHNENITDEFALAFRLYHAEEFGERAEIQWRDVGGGSSAIVRFIRNVYAESERSGIDVLWGGGDYYFQTLAKEGLLSPMKLRADFLATVPANLGGVPMYHHDAEKDVHLWCGSTLSGFGFIYNATMLRRCNLPVPKRWDDLLDPRFAGLISLGDPTRSGSAAMAFEMIVQSEPDWPRGWAKLLGILANAMRFTDSAGSAANAPALGEALVATCIDFYGSTRVAEAPDELFYVSPVGQTAFTPDPIAILKSPPHPEMAQRFVDFVLSRAGQSIWALPPGHPSGPSRCALGRLPIRRDVFEAHAGQILPWVQNPFEDTSTFQFDLKMRKVRFDVLRKLIMAAAIDNLKGLRAARAKLVATGFDPRLREELNRLPDNIATPAGIEDVNNRLKDPTQAERIVTDWTTFFREKYRRIAAGSP